MPIVEAEQALDLGILVRRAVKRDSHAFGELYEIFRGPITRYVRSHVGTQGEAEDITGKVFLKAWQAIDRYQDRGRPFSAWLYRLAHNQVIDHHRTRREFSGLPDNFSMYSTPDNAFESVERKRAASELAQAFMTLTPEQRQVIEFKFLEGLDNHAIARRMNRKEGAIRALQMRGLGALRRELEERVFPLGAA
jgi:RNA polymerase sigma-70 factor (ECF subfamily)